MATTGTTPGSPVAFSLRPSFADVWAEARSQELLAIGVDMPIGLPASELRRSDIEARELLGPRRSSLFWTPPLCALGAADHAEANRLSREEPIGACRSRRSTCSPRCGRCGPC